MPVKPTLSLKKKLTFFKSDLGSNKTLNEKFNKIYTEQSGDWEKVFKKLTANKEFSKQLVNKLEFTHKLSQWTNENHKLVTAFQKDNSTNSMADIAAGFSRADFTKLVSKERAHGKGDTAKGLADKLYNELFHKEPTAMLKRILGDMKDPGKDKKGIKENTLKFLNNLPAGFNIKNTSVYEAFKDKSAFKGIPAELHETIKTEIKSLQRVTAISPVPEVIPVLLKFNITSAIMVSNMPEEQFVKAVSKQLGINGESVARQVHENACIVSAKSELLKG